jgi:hypothetical protein
MLGSTINSGERLQVTGQAVIRNNGNLSTSFKINDTNANASYIAVTASNTDTAIIANGNSAIPIDFYTGGSFKMRLDAFGALGINTAAPAYFLDVYGTAGIGVNTPFANQAFFEVNNNTIKTYYNGINRGLVIDFNADNADLFCSTSLFHIDTSNASISVNGYDTLLCQSDRVYIGDWNTLRNGTSIFINDTAFLISTYTNNIESGIKIDNSATGNGRQPVVSIGDHNFVDKGTTFIVDSVNDKFEFKGTFITTTSASGNSGNHLKVTINGTPYVIELKNP